MKFAYSNILGMSSKQISKTTLAEDLKTHEYIHILFIKHNELVGYASIHQIDEINPYLEYCEVHEQSDYKIETCFNGYFHEICELPIPSETYLTESDTVYHEYIYTFKSVIHCGPCRNQLYKCTCY